MKRIFFFFFGLFSVVYAQVVPNTSTGPASVSNVYPTPTAYDTAMKINFIRTWVASKPYTNENDVISSSRTIQEVLQTTKFFDGLGRTLQTVTRKVALSGTEYDFVDTYLYDQYGRETHKYIAYPDTADGKFKSNPFALSVGIGSYYGEQVAYNKTVYESSPLDRIDTLFAAGNSWAGSHIGIVTQYMLNTVADSVRVWTIGNGIDATPSTSAKYPLGHLYKTITKDEHGKKSFEYKDKEGNIVLRKVQLDASPSSHHTGWLCTYYIYDDLNNLRVVIQPEGVEVLTSNGWTLTSTLLDEQCFRYEYDNRGNVIVKKTPGAGKVFQAFDERDRLWLMQDSNLRQVGKWLNIQYDALNRDTLTALITPPSGFEVLKQKYYEDYSWVNGTGLSSTFINTYSTNTNYFYSPSNSTFPYPQSITPTYITNGMLTGTKTKVLGTSNTYLYAVNFYDDHERVIQMQSTNYSGGKDTVTNQYSFSGNQLRSLFCHEKSGTNTQAYKVLSKTNYDGVNRVIQIIKKVDNSPEVIITENVYNGLGELYVKRIGQTRDATNQNTYTSIPIDSFQYTYNIRGWLRGINKDFARANNSNNWFGMELCYDFGFSQTQLNENIAGVRWRTKGDGEQTAYGYTYDAFNRFTRGDFTQYTGSAWNTTGGLDFTVKDMGYDKNGNILSMTQKAWKLSGSFVMDSLAYGYNTYSNRLSYVTDRTNDTTSRLGDFTEYDNNTYPDYSYDGNGNITADQNKLINNIFYNHLNLPDSIRILFKGTIKYIYDADGIKLKKITIDTTVNPAKTTETVYLNGFEYKNDTLEFISHEEGRIRPKRSNYTDTMYYDYFEKDHLGNVRILLTDELRTDAYPAATMELANATIEEALYDAVNNTRVDPPASYPSNTPPGNQKVAVVVGNSMFGPAHLEIGPGKLLKVMAGDKFNLQVNSWWDSDAKPSESSNPLGLYQLISQICGSPIISQTHFDYYALQNSSELNTAVSSFLGSQSWDPDLPKAFINWILFDEQFNYVSSSSGYEQVGSNLDYTTHTRTNMPVDKSGYLYVYVSNETPGIDVYFDNLQVTHIRGPLLEETSYYPFGLAQKGIGSKALSFGDPKNKEKTFQSQRLDDDLELNWVQFKWRNHDPQIGRFIQVDPLSHKYVYNSTYAFSENKVTKYIELEGLEIVDPTGITYGATDAYTRKNMSQSGKSDAEIDSYINNYNRIQATGTLVGATATAAVLFPNIAGPILAAEIFGVPSPTSPTSIASTTISEGRSVVSTATSEVNVFERAKQIHSALPAATQRRTTTAVATATTEDGTAVTLVASSEKKLRSAQLTALQPGEVAVSGAGHAETTIMNHASATGMKVGQIAASRPICQNCASNITNGGAQAASVIKKTGAKAVAAGASAVQN
jgi:RHS repeat-associated protein